MSSIVQNIAENLAENFAINEVNDEAAKKIKQKDPYHLPLPQGLSQHDADVLKRCRRRAHQLDHNAVVCYCFPCCFGLNTAICLIPMIGPWWASTLSGRVATMAEEADIPATLVTQMTANIAFDFLISLPPVIGALFNWMHKCNTRNVALLDTYLRKRAQQNLAKGPPPLKDVTTSHPPNRVDTRFSDVQTQPHPVQPTYQQPRAVPMTPYKPARGRTGDQEMGVV